MAYTREVGKGVSSPCLLRRRQGGQALVLSLFTVGIVILVMFAMYSMGQQTIAKIKLQNTADAAAYSAAQAQARDYNFAAYINRAMVANQVAVAQVVGLTSWSRDYGNTYDGKFSWVPDMLVNLGASPLSRLWTVPWDIHKSVGSGFRSTFNAVGPITVKLLDLLIDTLGTAQMVYHYGTGLTIAQTVGLDIFGADGALAQLGMDQSFFDNNGLTDILTLNPAYNIVKLNDANARLSLPGKLAVLIGLVQWFGFTENKDPNTAAKDGKDADRFAQVTVDSLDEFSKNRSTKDAWYSGAPEVFYLTPAPFLIDPTRFIPYQNGAFMMWLWHRGGTELKNVDDKKRTWSAMDATGFTGGAIFWISILGIPIPIPIIIPTMPMGWGAAQAGDDGDLDAGDNFGTDAGDAYGGVYAGFNTAAPAVIQRGEGAGSSMGKLPLSGGGLRKYFDVKKVTDKDDNLVAPSLLIEVEKAGSNLPDSNSLAGGRFALTAGTQSGYMRTLSKAQAYFSRPAKLWARDDDKTEQGSLYSPYWQARLVANSFLEQYISMSYHLH